MKLFLHIRIIDDPLIFSNDTISKVRSWLPDISVFDIDNFSDAATIQTAVRALEEAERVFLYVEGGTEATLVSTLKVFSTLPRVKGPVAIFQEGQNEMLSKLMVRFRKQQVEEGISMEEAVKSFFKES